MNVRENLKAYLDSELTASERAEVEEALRLDSSLRNELEQLRQISLHIAASPLRAEPTGLEATLHRLNRPQAQRPFLLPVTISTASVILLAGIVLMTESRKDLPFRDESPMPLPKRRDPGGHPNGFKFAADVKVSIAVSDFEGAAHKMGQLAMFLGGSVGSPRHIPDASRPKEGFTLTVPIQKLREAISGLKGLGSVEKIEWRGDSSQPELSNASTSGMSAISVVMHLKAASS